MKSILFIFCLLIAGAGASQTYIIPINSSVQASTYDFTQGSAHTENGHTYTGLIMSKHDTLVFRYCETVEIDGHLYNLNEEETCPVERYVTASDSWIQDCKGSRYQVRPETHKDCHTIHLDPEGALYLSLDNKVRARVNKE